MEGSRLLEVFRSLSKAERTSLRRYLSSPYFNQREDLLLLFDHLDRYAHAADPSLLTKAAAWKNAYPGQRYKESTMNHAMSFLYQHLQQFLIEEAQQKDTAYRQLILGQELRRRGLHRQFESAARKLDKQFESALVGIDHYYYDYLLNYEKSDYAISRKREQAVDFLQAADSLNVFFLAHHLRLSCSAILQKTFARKAHQLALQDELIRFLETGHYQDVPVVALYYAAYRMLSSPEADDDFFALRSLMREHQARLTRRENHDLYVLAINYGIRQFNQGKPDFLKELFILYKEGLDNEVFIENGLLSKFTYNNIVMAAVLLKEFEWAERFLYDYKPMLDKKDRESFFNYNLAILYYRKPDYDKAMELLRSVEFNDVLHNLDARRMLLKIYYELEEYDALSSLLISFHAFIYRHQELGYHKTNYLNLIRFTKKLLQLDFYNKTAREKLRREIAATDSLAEKTWLMDQLEK